MNKKFWIPFIVLCIVGGYGLSKVFFDSSSKQAKNGAVEGNLDKAKSATTSVARDILLDSEDVASDDESSLSIESTEESIVESDAEETSSRDEPITKAEDDAAAKAFYEEQARNDNAETMARLVERANHDEKYLVLDDESVGDSISDPDEAARIERLREQAEEAEKLLPQILGEEEYTTKDSRKIEELRKRADEAEKFLPPIDD